MKNKSEKETAKAFKKILNEYIPPKNMQSDNGNEFLNRSFKEITDKFQINHHTAEPLSPCSSNTGNVYSKLKIISFSPPISSPVLGSSGEIDA